MSARSRSSDKIRCLNFGAPFFRARVILPPLHEIIVRAENRAGASKSLAPEKIGHKSAILKDLNLKSAILKDLDLKSEILKELDLKSAILKELDLKSAILKDLCPRGGNNKIENQKNSVNQN